MKDIYIFIYDLQSLGEDEGSRESFNPLFGQVFHFFSNFHLWKCFDHNNNFLSPIMPYISYMCFGRERERDANIASLYCAGQARFLYGSQAHNAS